MLLNTTPGSVDFNKFYLYLIFVRFAGSTEVENHLDMGREFLARGQLQDALSHYHAAVGK